MSCTHDHDRGPIDLTGRRTFLKVAAMGGLSALLFEKAAYGLPAWIQEGTKTGAPRRAKRCVFLYLAGGPSHLDTFDPKPGTENGGPFAAIETAVSGIRISEHLPMLAKEMKDVALIRSMTSREGNHERARYLVQTGYAPQPTVTHPGLGSILSHEVAAKEIDLPAFVAVGGNSLTGGYFGTRHSPFVVQRATKGLDDVAVSAGVSEERFAARRRLLRELDQRFEKKVGPGPVEPHASIYDRAERLMKSPLLSAFEVAKEDEKVREAYGADEFGQGCLMARRLLEVGVTCVQVTLNGWDTHQDNFEKVKGLSGTLDRAASQLIRDLRSRGMLKDTLVVCFGEFGRTPKISGTGRDHWPGTWSALAAGGGVKGGQVWGATTDDGMAVKDQPVSVPDLFATFASVFGIDAAQVNFAGPRPITLVDKGTPVAGLLA